MHLILEIAVGQQDGVGVQISNETRGYFYGWINQVPTHRSNNRIYNFCIKGNASFLVN